MCRQRNMIQIVKAGASLLRFPDQKRYVKTPLTQLKTGVSGLFRIRLEKQGESSYTAATCSSDEDR